jgi:outer membrane protein assembly factor BamB
MARLYPKPYRFLTRSALVAIALAGTLGSSGVAAAHEEGGIEWSQFQGGPGHPGTIAQAPLPPYRERWRFSPPEGALSGAVLTSDLAIAVGRKAVHGIDLASGEQVWEIPRSGGPLSTPALAPVDGRTVLLYLDGPPAAPAGPSPSPSPADGTARRSELVAVDLAERSELWRTALRGVSRSGLTLEGDLAYVGDDAGTVYAVEIGSGRIAWTAEAAGRVESPPALADGQVYVASRSLEQGRTEVLALDAETGERRWTFAPQAGALVLSALAAADGQMVLGAGDQLVRGLAAEDGSLRWQALALNLFSPLSAPAYQPGNVYIADAAGGLYRLNPADGRRDWEHQTNELIVRSSPVLVGRYVVIGLGDGRLAAFDAGSGDLVHEIATSPGFLGELALSHEVLVAVKGGGEPGVIAFEHDPDASLVRIPSPTIPVPERLLGWFALAAAIVAAVILVPFRFLAPRFGPAFTREDELPAEAEAGLEGEDR